VETVKYVPELCKGESAMFAGYVELKLPTFDEKYAFLESSGLDLDDAGALVMPNVIGKIKLMRTLVKQSEKSYSAVSLKNLKSGKEFSTYEQMTIDPDCHPILIDVATQLINGLRLGN
jgi:hypothetical protein